MKILLKISWESLKWEKQFWIEPNYVLKMVDLIKEIKQKWHSLSVVVWWWNIYRWTDLIKSWVCPADSHNLSMLSTIFNWVVLKNFLNNLWVKSEVMWPLWVDFVQKYTKDWALKYLNDGYVLILVWWTGNPFFTTDSWWVLRSVELWVDMMIKATRVDWVFDKDPEKTDDAKFFEEISCDDILSMNLKVIDQTAIVMAKENNLDLRIANINKPECILELLDWKNIWTKIYS